MKMPVSEDILGRVVCSIDVTAAFRNVCNVIVSSTDLVLLLITDRLFLQNITEISMVRVVLIN